MGAVCQFLPLLYDREDVLRRLNQTLKTLFVANLRTALFIVGWILLLTRLVTTLVKDGPMEEMLYTMVGTEVRLVEVPLHLATWTVVTISSTACMCLQGSLLRLTPWAIVWPRTKTRWLVFICLLTAGLFSALTFLSIVNKATGSIDRLEKGTVLKIPFYLTALARSAQSIFSAFFTAVIAPMSWYWAQQLDEKQKKALTKLLSWRVLLYVHWNIIIPTFMGFDVSIAHWDLGAALPHVASFVYRNLVIIWLILLSAYINSPPLTRAQEELVVPVNSELVGVVPTFSALSQLCFDTQRAEENERVPRGFHLIELTPNRHEMIIPIKQAVTYPQNSEVVIGITSPVHLSAQEGDELVILRFWRRGTPHVNYNCCTTY